MGIKKKKKKKLRVGSGFLKKIYKIETSIDVVALVRTRALRVNIVELNVIVEVASDKVHSFIDLDRFREFAIGLQVARFVSRVLEDNISLRILIVTKANKDNVGLVYPRLLPELAPDVAESFHPVEAHCLEASVAQHLCHLGVLLAILLEDQLSLQALVLVLSSPPVLSSLSFVLRHLEPKAWSH